MYYLVVNNKKKYSDYLDKEAIQFKENRLAFQDFIGVKFTSLLRGDSGFNCVYTVDGIVPDDESIKEIKGMKRSKRHPQVFVPNKRTARGKKIMHFLQCLPNWSYETRLDLLGVPKKGRHLTRFVIPHLLRYGKDIVVHLDDHHYPDETELKAISVKEVQVMYNKAVKQHEKDNK